MLGKTIIKMKPHILFVMHYLELGGAEKSLVGLLRAIDYSRFDVDLFLYSHRGELMREIPKEVRLLPETAAYACIECPVKDALRKGQWGVVWGRLKAKWQYKRYARRMHPKDGSAIFQYVMNAVEPHLPSLHHLGEYDLVVSFLTPHNVVLKKVRAKRKACWIHTDYTQIDVNTALELPVWSGYDHIVSISADVTKAFLSVFPTLKDKIVEIHNILPTDFVRSRAEEMTAEEVAREMPREEGVINLLSVGRFSHAKNYDNVPAICRIINSQLSIADCQCRWYLIGYGGEEPLIRQRIAEEGMEGKVIILGKRENPYPFIKACDVYVQPSRYEGNAVTVREAQMLCKPVVVTSYPTATSQIHDGVDGIIVSMDNKGCAFSITYLIQDYRLQQAFHEYLEVHDYSNCGEIKKLYNLIEP
jgi:glycosyltransferase involved in cell wall biosynthesis